MPHSLRVRLKRLNCKDLLRDTDTDRLIKALDVVDGLQDVIAEIKNMPCGVTSMKEIYVNRDAVLDIIRKHTGVET